MWLRIKFGKPIFGASELAAVLEVLKKRRLTQGGNVLQFEERFQETVGGGRAVAVSSCMAALHLAYLAKGIGPGDEVLVPALTHVATVHAVELVGAKPVFIDAHPSSGQMDTDLIEAQITPRTKALGLVHFLGSPAYMRTTMDMARRHNLYVVEDCALALGTQHNGSSSHVGLIGDVGCFSFYPVKHITTGEGGMFLTKHPELADRAAMMRSFGQDGDKNAVLLGLNYRMTEMAAALGLEQLKRFADFRHRREANERFLRHALAGFDLLGHNYALAVKVPDTKDRDDIRHRLLVDHQVETSVYYPCAVPSQRYYRAKYGRVECPVADMICARYITMSVGPHLGEEDMIYQAKAFKRLVK